MKSSKKNILFLAIGGKNWIGGVYYVKNIIYMLLQNKNNNLFNITILLNKKNRTVFECFKDEPNVSLINYKPQRSIIDKIINKLSYTLLFLKWDRYIFNIVKNKKIDYIYPISNSGYFGIKNKIIYWIPDFQHIHLAHFFTTKEIKYRNKTFKYIAKNHKKLVLSSKNAFEDYKKLYPKYINNTYIINFISYIEKELLSIDKEFEKLVLKKYKLTNDYIYLPNQFWAHKNHITVFKAMNILINEKKINICLLCTGNINDHRNKEFYNTLTTYLKLKKLEKNIKILGFLPRKDQLVIMKNAKFILQPSLFEGWGTVVEDAKVMNKKILLSDICIHKEQMDGNCILFEAENHKDLADKIKKEDTSNYEDNLTNGIIKSKNSAKIYSKKLVDLFRD